MNKRNIILNPLLILALASLACNFGTQLFSSQDNPSSQVPPTLPDPAPTNSAPAGGTVNPIDIKVSLDEKSAATVLITSAGGSLTATAADGTAFTLTFPADAVPSDQQITLTPASTIDGLPFSGGLVGAVQMAPEGLQLLQAATLTIESPKTVAAQGFETVAFGYHQNGEGMYLDPSDASGNVLTLEVWHFSGVGAAQGTAAEVAAQQEQHVPKNAEDAYTQRMQQYLGRERQSQLLGQGGDPQFQETMFKNMHEAYKNFIAPLLPIALEDCAKAPAILARALSVLRQIELLGAQEEFQAERDQILDTIDKVKAKCSPWKVDGVYWAVYHLTGTICALDKPFTLNAEANPISAAGVFVFSPAGASSGAWSYNGLMGGLKYNGSSTYQIEGVAEGAPVIVFNPGNNWSITMPNLGTFPLGEGTHLGSGAPERITLEPATEGCSLP